MITNNGKTILAKYLIGTAPAFASYLAVGCGAKPLAATATLTGASGSTTTITVASTSNAYIGAVVSISAGTGTIPSGTKITQIISGTQIKISAAPTVALASATLLLSPDANKKVLDFEMFRVPITSRGYINDGGVDKIVLTAELPTEERYEISEVGLFSAGSNTIAGAYDSKTIFTFSNSETWKYNNGISLVSPTPVTSPLAPYSDNIITTAADAVQTTADNPTFTNATRLARYESPRYLNSTIMLRGNTSHISKLNGNLVIDSSPKYLQLSGTTFYFDKNSPADILKTALSIINVYGDVDESPDALRIVIKFSNDSDTQSAIFQSEILNSNEFFKQNRYSVASNTLDNGKYTSTFSWAAMTMAKIYVSAIDIVDATNISATGGTVTLTTGTHSLPVDATITGVSTSEGVITFTASNTFTPGDIVSITGITSNPPNAFDLSNVKIVECNSSSFKVENTATGTYYGGGSAKISNAKITFAHSTSSYTGTYSVTSVPNTTSVKYFVTGASLSSTALTNATVDISSNRYFVSLDACRLDNINTINPLYGMTGYSIIQNIDSETIKKNQNTSSYIEFRFNLGVA